MHSVFTKECDAKASVARFLIINSNEDCKCEKLKGDVSEGEQNVLQKDDRSPVNYLERNIFPLLVPAVEEMLIQANEHNALRIQKCRFNGLDYLAEILWNRNPRRVRKLAEWLNVFDIPRFKEMLRAHPRPLYPKSWLWSEEEAVLLLQRNVRGWLVRKRDDVQEMREFWKNIAAEKADLDKTISVGRRQNSGEVTDDGDDQNNGPERKCMNIRRV